MKVVILAGGFGTRLAEQTDEIPKPMVEIGGRPILWHILKIYSHFGFNDFIIACGYRAEAIKRFFLDYRNATSDLVIDFVNDRVERLGPPLEPWRVTLADTGLKTATGGRLRHLADLLGDETFLMTYGDGVADIDLPRLVEFHRTRERAVTFTAVHPPSGFGHPRLEGDRAVAFAEKDEADGHWINGGFFVIEPTVLTSIDGPQTSFEAEVLPRLATAGQLTAYRHEGFWQPMDTLRDVRALNALWAGGTAPWQTWA
ncbi:MAG: glucose-1-phosphate cytidylyltransferase [Planctomycetes bacterium]|nr:glucose-1-phosphate cytidylyltransferase [Planctomycetota bacterium]